MTKRRILVAECQQEISSFNPAPSEYSLFDVHQGQDLFDAHEGAETCVRGALDVLRARGDLELVPLWGAKACSAGPLSRAGFERIGAELLGAIRANAQGVDGMYFCLHGAMGAEGEHDPEGFFLEQTRAALGPQVPIVVSLDLHGVLTDRMLRNCDAIVVYHTYPHEDFVDTGERAARLLLRILDDGVRPTMARVTIPALVRGPELITRTGLYGEVIGRAQAMEREEGALAAAVLIGNPFTDVPELGTQALVVTDADGARAARQATELAELFWSHHETMIAPLVTLGEAIADAAGRTGPVTFTDAADAPSSGASGDGNAILAGLLEHAYQGTVLMPIVDAPAAAAAHAAGVGAKLRLPLGGTVDPGRFPPIELDVEVDRLGDGEYENHVFHLPMHAGPTAVLRHGNVRIVAVSEPVLMMDRSIFEAHGLDPETADLVVVKSPGAYARFFTYAERNYVVDVPGATSANLARLGHVVCPRPIFPLDEDVPFSPRVDLYERAPVWSGAVSLRTRPLDAPFGVELLDLDLASDGPGEVSALLDLLADEAFVLARRQSFSDAELAAFAHALGPVGIASRRSSHAPGHPEVMYVSNLKDQDDRLIGGLSKADHAESIWHSDQSFRTDPATLSTLFCVNAPEEGGGTGFLSTVLAWEALDPAMRRRLEPLRGLYRPRPSHEIAIVEVSHPVVLTNPRSGRPALYMSELCHGFEGLDEHAGEALLGELLAHLDDPGLRYTHAWRMGDIALYDNAQLLHRREAFAGLRWLKATRSRADPSRFALVDG